MASIVHIEGEEVVGELALAVAPGTLAAARDKLLDALLSESLSQANREWYSPMSREFMSDRTRSKFCP